MIPSWISRLLEKINLLRKQKVTCINAICKQRSQMHPKTTLVSSEKQLRSIVTNVSSATQLHISLDAFICAI